MRRALPPGGVAHSSTLNNIDEGTSCPSPPFLPPPHPPPSGGGKKGGGEGGQVGGQHYNTLARPF
jgi:hypothetical protein